MFLSLFTRRLAAGLNSTLMHAGLRLYSGTGRPCSGTRPCTMEYPKKKCEEPECQPREPCCPLPFGKCPAVKEILCKEKPECCGSKRLTQDPCNCKGAREQFNKKEVKLERRIQPQTAVWEYPAECCGNPCPDLLPRFDSLYYSPTDKAKRQYQQTWVECPPVQIRKRRICCYDSTELPPICRRKKEECPITACEFDSRKMKALCSSGTNTKCARIQMPCCIRGRYPPTCSIAARTSTNCKKKCCPYPSFSECCYRCPPPKRKTECQCTALQPNCVVFRHLKRKMIYDLPPPLPAWPPKMQGPR
ncbi:hypothetical protein FF38_08749 [Lucilia cuprina]|uniref:Uncharacterized protein n=1 Tax=Lucilia cuprina TaxID=7375 RepID=A0A0L0CQC3_LUCCU|nr:hypothetical protein CVS40_5562 [Lucilia cuprina]KNC33634.1 hypothetical protein FF38_08749 [Lucilia cuprina]